MTRSAPSLDRINHGQRQHSLIDATAFTVLPTAISLVQELFASSTGDTTDEVRGAMPPTGSGDETLCVVTDSASVQDAQLRLELPPHSVLIAEIPLAA